jgi:hypothetical protein
MDVGLVSCTKQKASVAKPPGELYLASDYFQKMRAYAEQHHDRWYILSAKHGLLLPDGPPIEPYDETLCDATAAERQRWAETVFDQLEDERLIQEGTTFVIHAGKDYYGELLPRLRQTPVDVELPTAGLGLGERLSWYDTHTPTDREC